jgi:hypothetical protein
MRSITGLQIAKIIFPTEMVANFIENIVRSNVEGGEKAYFFAALFSSGSKNVQVL